MNPLRNLAIGARLGSYTVEGVLGRGGMGVVYAATDAAGTAVAIKVLAAELVFDPQAARRFGREALAAQKVKHPNVARLIQAAEQPAPPGTPPLRYLVFELVPGGSLRTKIEATGPLPWAPALALAIPIAHGLAAIHAAGVVHRDLKPDNVLLALDGTPRIADFGLVRRAPGRSSLSNLGDLTRPGQFLGTPAYMAPEQVDRPEDVDGRADLYSFGAILFSLLAGRAPFDGEGIALLNAVMNSPAPRVSTRAADVPPALDALVASLLAKSPDERPATAAAVVAALESLAGVRGLKTGDTSRGALVARALGGLVVVALLAVGAFRLARSSSSPRGPGSDPKASPNPGASAAPGPITRTPATPTPGNPDASTLPAICQSFLATPPTRLARVLGSYGWHAQPRGGTCTLLADGRVVSGGWDHVLRVVEPRTGEETIAIDVHDNVISLAALDERRVLVGFRFSAIEAWDVDSRRLCYRLSDIEGAGNVRRIAIASNGHTVYGLGDHGRLASWDVAGREPRLNWIAEIEARPGVAVPESLAGGLSPDGLQFVTGSSDGHLRIWNTAVGSLVSDIAAPSYPIASCFFTHDGTRIVAVCREPSVYVVHVETRECELRIPLPAPADSHDARVPDDEGTFAKPEPGALAFALALAPDHHSLVAARVGEVIALDLADPKVHRVIARHASFVRELFFAPDGQTVLSIGDDGVTHWSDFNTGEDRRAGRAALESDVGALAVAGDGKSALVSQADGRLRVIALASGAVTAVLDETSPALALALSHDGTRALVLGADADRTVSTWDLKAGKRLRSFATRDGTGGIAFLSAGSALEPLGGGVTGAVHWDDGSVAWRLPGESLVLAQMTPDNKLFTVSSAGSLKIRDATTRAILESTEHGSGVLWAAPVARGWLVVDRANKASLTARGPRGGRALWETALENPVVSAAVSPDERRLAIATSRFRPDTLDATIVVLDAVTGEVQGRVEISKSADFPRAVAFVPGSGHLLVGTARGVVLDFEVGN